LKLRFRSNGQIVSEVLELACGEQCSEIEVLVEGGTPPYDIRWEDGAKGAKREVCAGEGPLAVSVKDSGESSGEFGQRQLSGEADLGVQRGACSDAGGIKECRVVTSAISGGGCNEGGHDTDIQFQTTLPAGRYEFRYEMTVVGEGQFGVYASAGQCQSKGPELGRIEFNGAPIGGTKTFGHTCQTLTEGTTGLFIDQMIPVWGAAFFDVTTVCEGCPSRGE
jgi:hypothetical protein